MKQLYKILLLTSIIILILNGCKKRVEVKETIVYVSPSNISSEYFKDKVLISYAPVSATAAILPDSVITNTIDIDHDGVTDINGYIEVYHSDTTTYIKSYLRKTNPEIEILCQEQDTVLLLSCYTDQQSYITPNPTLWRPTSLKEEYTMNDYSIIRCNIGGIMYNCFGQRKYGRFTLSSRRYFIGFRIKNKTSTQYEFHWNYGYLQVNNPGSGTTVLLEKIAIENNIDQPILMQTSFSN